MEKLTLYIKESYDELLNKVTWPTLPNLQSTTIVVLIATVIMTLLIFIMDGASKILMSHVYKIPEYLGI